MKPSFKRLEIHYDSNEIELVTSDRETIQVLEVCASNGEPVFFGGTLMEPKLRTYKDKDSDLSLNIRKLMVEREYHETICTATLAGASVIRRISRHEPTTTSPAAH